MIKTLRDIDITIDRAKVLRYFGYRSSAPSPDIAGFEDILSIAERLMRPEIYYTVSSVDSNGEGTVSFGNGIRLSDTVLLDKVREDHKGLFFLASLGHGLEACITGFLEKGLCLEGTLLDGACWVALQEVIRDFKKTFVNETVDFTLVPGLRNFPLERQKDIFSLFSGRETGMTLTEECMVIPRKSLSGIMIFH